MHKRTIKPMIVEGTKWMSAMGCCLIALILTLGSCTRHGDYDESLARADSLMNMAPDSALAILDSLEPSAKDFSKSDLRRWQLLRLMAQNKCVSAFSSDSLQLILTDYYDHHGTPNERMMAYYLLGRARSDMGETPEAMRCYQDAITCADTSSVDCDWWNLSRIHLQLADEYYLSFMPMEEKEALEHSRICALHARDTVTSIIAFAKLSEVYELMDLRDSSAIVIREAVRFFKDYGRDDLASQMSGFLLESEVEKGNLEEAARIIRYYESCSDYFDENHEIENGREMYYYSKGIYYLGAGQADSAECMFRKLLSKAQGISETHAAYWGLRKKYLTTGSKDSLVKYAMLSESSNDTLYQEHYKDNIHLLQKRFNYSRHVENEQRLMISSAKKDKLIMVATFTSIVLSLLALCGSFILRNRKNRIINQKIQEIELLQNTITYMEEGNTSTNDRLNEFEESDIVKRLKRKASNNEHAGLADLGELRDAAIKHLPVFIGTLSNTGYELQSHETNRCILIKAGFRPSEIAVLMNLTPQNITNLRARLNKKMFHTDKGAKDFNEKIINLTS